MMAAVADAIEARHPVVITGDRLPVDDAGTRAQTQARRRTVWRSEWLGAASDSFLQEGIRSLPARHITDCQTRLYMKSRQSHLPAIAAAKAGFSIATAYRIEADPRLPSRRRSPENAGVRTRSPVSGIARLCRCWRSHRASGRWRCSKRFAVGIPSLPWACAEPWSGASAGGGRSMVPTAM
jgi:hypothetical protein